MTAKFLELDKGVIVEIGGPLDERSEMHTATAEKVDTTLAMVGSMLGRILEPIGKAIHGMKEALDTPVAVESAEVEIGVSFSAEGNLFIAKTTAEGNLTVKVTFKSIAEPAKAPVIVGGAAV